MKWLKADMIHCPKCGLDYDTKLAGGYACPRCNEEDKAETKEASIIKQADSEERIINTFCDLWLEKQWECVEEAVSYILKMRCLDPNHPVVRKALTQAVQQCTHKKTINWNKVK